MSDPREVLERAAAWPERELDMGALRRRARGRRTARWTAGSLAAVIVAGAAALAVGVEGGRSGSVEVVTRPDIGEPAPGPTPGPLLADATVVTVGPAGPRPERIVGVTKGGAAVLVDAATGSTVRELFRLADRVRRDPGAPPPNTLGDIALSSDGRTVYFTSVGEPACGSTKRAPVSGGAAEDRAGGDFVSASPGGRHVATSGCSLAVLPGPAGSPAGTADPAVGASTRLGALAWSADGRYLAVERHPDLPGGGPTDILVFDLLTARTIADAVVLRDPDGIGYQFPAFRRDGRLVVAQQRAGSDNATARALDPQTGALVASFPYGGAVKDQSYDASHTWLLVTMADDSLRWFGGGQQGTLPSRFTAADW